MAKNRYLDEFMKTFPYEGLTYDDVTLVTQYADFLPDDTSLETQLTSRQKMNIPFISAAMDTVTEAPMAIAMALAGGIRLLPRERRHQLPPQREEAHGPQVQRLPRAGRPGSPRGHDHELGHALRADDGRQAFRRDDGRHHHREARHLAQEGV